MAKKSTPEPEKTPEDLLREKLSELLLDNEDVGDAMIIFTLKGSNEPMVWRKGHWYDVAALTTEVLNAYKIKAIKELGL